MVKPKQTKQEKNLGKKPDGKEVKYKASENIKKYSRMKEKDLIDIIRKYPFFVLPKIALLLKKGDEDKDLLNHVALTVYDRSKLQEYVEHSDFFPKGK